MNPTEEIWKDVVGYEGLYMVSNKGNVKTLSRQTFMADGTKCYRFLKEKILSKIYNKGYIRCTLRKNGKANQIFVHRLVAVAFIPNPDNKHSVNHIDFNPANNCVENLNWMTPKENSAHSYHRKSSASKRFLQHLHSIKYNYKAVIMIGKDGSVIREYTSMKDASIDVAGNKCSSQICCHIKYPEKYKTAYGYTWKLKTA